MLCGSSCCRMVLNWATGYLALSWSLEANEARETHSEISLPAYMGLKDRQCW